MTSVCDRNTTMFVPMKPFLSLPGFKNGRSHFLDLLSDTTNWPISGILSVDVIFLDWKPSWVGTKNVPDPRYYHVMETPKIPV